MSKQCIRNIWPFRVYFENLFILKQAGFLMYSDSLWQDFLCTRMTFSQKESKPPFNLGTFPFWVKMQTQTLSATEFSFSSSSSLKCWRQQLFEFSLECQCQRNFLSRIRFPTFLPSQCREDWKKRFLLKKVVEQDQDNF